MFLKHKVVSAILRGATNLLVGDGPAVDLMIVPEVFFRIIRECPLHGNWEFDSPCEHQFLLR